MLKSRSNGVREDTKMCLCGLGGGGGVRSNLMEEGDPSHPHTPPTSKNPAYFEFLTKKNYFFFVLLWLLVRKVRIFSKKLQKISTLLRQ